MATVLWGCLLGDYTKASVQNIYSHPRKIYHEWTPGRLESSELEATQIYDFRNVFDRYARFLLIRIVSHQRGNHAHHTAHTPASFAFVFAAPH